MEGGMMLLFDAQLPGPLSYGQLHNFLMEGPGIVGMTRISEPLIAFGTNGITGMVILGESHIAVHENRARAAVQVHAFSCKGFNADVALGEFVKILGAIGIIGEYLVIPRALPDPVQTLVTALAAP